MALEKRQRGLRRTQTGSSFTRVPGMPARGMSPASMPSGQRQMAAARVNVRGAVDSAVNEKGVRNGHSRFHGQIAGVNTDIAKGGNVRNPRTGIDGVG